MEVHCPYCEADLSVDTQVDYVRCGECLREFSVQGKQRVKCPECGAILGVPAGASVVLCGTCRHRLVLGSPPADEQTAFTARMSEEEPSTTGDDETSVIASPQHYEELRLTAIREQFADKYEVLEQLGRGGMGAIYKARQLQPERLVVLKLMLHGRFASEKYRMRFEREAQAIARLKHPNIVSVYEFGEVNGQPYFTMEYVEGSNVKAYARGRRLDKREICRLMLKTARAVAYAHQRGVIHRDIKPSNILVDGTGNPQLLDFGLAQLAGGYGDEHDQMTEVGEVMGTPSYMSPEQTLGRPDEIDIRSDVYSLGVLFYELVTGTLPYRVDRTRPLESLRVIREFSPRPPSEIEEAVDSDMDAIVMKCLEKERDLRYQSAVELAEDIGRYLRGQPVEARPSTSFYHLRKLLWRHRSFFLPILVGGVAIFLVTAFTVFWLARQSQQAREEASAAIEQKEQLVDFVLQLGAVRSGVDDLLAQGRWEDAWRAARFAEQQLPAEAGLQRFSQRVRDRIAVATSGEVQQVRKLIEQLRFREASERLGQLRVLAGTVGLSELSEKVQVLDEQFDDACWQSVFSYIERNGGSVRALKQFLRECPNSTHAAEARSLLQKLLIGIRFSEWPFDPEEAVRRRKVTAKALDIPYYRQLQLDGETALDLVLIPAGEFVMGAPENGRDYAADQKPAHRVRISSPFYVSSTEVTRRQFEAVTGRRAAPPEGDAEAPADDDLPACVSYEDARVFCSELSRRRHLIVRLPTEAEWEYACRAGARDVFGHAGSPEALLEQAWCRENSDGRPHPAAQKQPNAWGLHDVYGNMLEWCRDWYDSRYYYASPVDDPKGPDSGTYRVLRGGSWADKPQEVHAAFRKAHLPDSRGPMYGFRVCVEVFTEQSQEPLATNILSGGG
ncbi:MAG: bifunctional serine/threonine-protein kinase/formylglycine-generating enzyme family protein [Candidatus Brocadiia bacterium]